jgi:chromosome segregation ATPase
MDERKNKIRELEAKKRADVNTKNQMLEGLGEELFRRIGKEEPFDGSSGDTPGAVLAEYLRLQKGIDDSADTIAALEKELLRLKELEEAISAREAEKSRLEKELDDVYAGIGQALFEDPDYHDATGVARRQEESLLARISEQEKKLEELEEREGGIFTWLGKNAQMTVSKTLLSKNRAALRRLYSDAGEKYFSAKPVESLVGNVAEAAEKVLELRELLSALNADLAAFKGERRKIGDQFGTEGSPSRRINGLEKYIVLSKEKFPALYLGMGSFAEAGEKVVSSFLSNEDEPVLENARLLQSRIAQTELEIEKIKAAISLDDERAEIRKMKKAIQAQEQKINAARETILEIEDQIAETERHIGELQAFLDNPAVAQEEYGG